MAFVTFTKNAHHAMRTLEDESFITIQHDGNPNKVLSTVLSYKFPNSLLLRNSHSKAYNYLRKARLAWHLSLSYPPTQFNHIDGNWCPSCLHMPQYEEPTFLLSPFSATGTRIMLLRLWRSRKAHCGSAASRSSAPTTSHKYHSKGTLIDYIFEYNWLYNFIHRRISWTFRVRASGGLLYSMRVFNRAIVFWHMHPLLIRRRLSQ